MSQTKAQLINAKGDAAFDTNTLYVDAANNRIGVGTSSPNTKAHLYDSSNTALKIESTGANYVETNFINSSAAYTLGIRPDTSNSFCVRDNTASATRIVLDSSGRVGIGVADAGSYFSDARNLVVGNTAGDAGVSIVSNSSNKGTIAFADGTTGDQAYRGYIQYSHNGDALAFATSGTEAFRVDSSRRLLVGTSTARSNFFNSTFTSQVQIEGTTNNTASAALIRSSNDNGGTVLYLAKQRGGIGANTIVANGDRIATVSFQGSDGTEFVEAAKIDVEVDNTPGTDDMPGRFVFSVTQDGQASPTGRFWINNGGYSYFQSIGQGAAFATTQGAGTTYETILAGHTATNGTFNSINVSFRVFSNGNVQNTNNSYGAISDLKLKENIVNANPQWDDIKALQVRNYNFKEGQTHTQIGLVAQEVELVSPGLVTESPDRDAEGNDLGTVTKSVNYSVLYMKAVKALQEAMERIETLEAKVAALETP